MMSSSACSTKLSSDDLMASHAMSCYGAARDPIPYMPPSSQMPPYTNNAGQGPTAMVGLGAPGYFQSSAVGSGEASYGLGACSKASTIFAYHTSDACFGIFEGNNAAMVNFIPQNPMAQQNEPKQFYLGTPFNQDPNSGMKDPVSRPVASSFGSYSVSSPSCGL